MITYIYHLIIYQPLYNGLIFLMDAIPWADAGIAIILFTIIVKLILFPLSKKSVSTQIQMKKFEPDLKAIKEKYKEDTQEQARQTMAFYKDHKINPFSSILLLLIQLPIIIALYRVFLRSGLPVIDKTLLYSFIHVPDHVSTIFLGLLDISHKSIILAFLAGITTFLQVWYSVPAHKKQPEGSKKSFQDDLARTMNMQMRYFFPIIAFFISWSISGVIALYWITSNLFTIGQELVIRRKFKS